MKDYGCGKRLYGCLFEKSFYIFWCKLFGFKIIRCGDIYIGNNLCKKCRKKKIRNSFQKLDSKLKKTFLDLDSEHSNHLPLRIAFFILIMEALFFLLILSLHLYFKGRIGI